MGNNDVSETSASRSRPESSRLSVRTGLGASRSSLLTRVSRFGQSLLKPREEWRLPWAKIFLVLLVVHLVYLFRNGSESLLAGFAWDTDFDAAVGVLGGNDAGRYLSGGLSIYEQGWIPREDFWTINNWPPGMFIFWSLVMRVAEPEGSLILWGTLFHTALWCVGLAMWLKILFRCFSPWVVMVLFSLFFVSPAYSSYVLVAGPLWSESYAAALAVIMLAAAAEGATRTALGPALETRSQWEIRLDRAVVLPLVVIGSLAVYASSNSFWMTGMVAVAGSVAVRLVGPGKVVVGRAGRGEQVMRTLEGGLTASILLVAVYAYTVNENFWVAGSLTLAAVARVLTYRGGSTRDSTGMIVSHRGASHALVAGCALGVGAYVRGNLEFMGTALTYLAGLFATCLIIGRWVSPGRKSKKQKRQRDQLFGVHGGFSGVAKSSVLSLCLVAVAFQAVTLPYRDYRASEVTPERAAWVTVTDNMVASNWRPDDTWSAGEQWKVDGRGNIACHLEVERCEEFRAAEIADPSPWAWWDEEPYSASEYRHYVIQSLLRMPHKWLYRKAVILPEYWFSADYGSITGPAGTELLWNGLSAVALAISVLLSVYLLNKREFWVSSLFLMLAVSLFAPLLIAHFETRFFFAAKLVSIVACTLLAVLAIEDRKAMGHGSVASGAT